jgi:hypothetical protein
MQYLTRFISELVLRRVLIRVLIKVQSNHNHNPKPNPNPNSKPKPNPKPSPKPNPNPIPIPIPNSNPNLGSNGPGPNRVKGGQNGIKERPNTKENKVSLSLLKAVEKKAAEKFEIELLLGNHGNM